jgi:hypothetical protein
MKIVLATVCSLMLVALAFGSNLATATFVRGDITKIDGKTLTVDDKATVTVSDATKVKIAGQELKIDALVVGQNITARIEEGTAVMIEVHAKGHEVHDQPAK